MPRLKNKVPAYCRHKASGQARVKFNGNYIYLGPHGTQTSRDEYDRLIAEWLANGRHVPSRIEGEPDRLICELIAAYWDHAQAYYVKNGQPTKEQANIRICLKRLNRLYAKQSVGEFGPLSLKGFRQSLIAENHSRSYIQVHVGHVKRMLRWGVENELVPPSSYHGLQAVVGLRKGRSAAREPMHISTGPLLAWP